MKKSLINFTAYLLFAFTAISLHAQVLDWGMNNEYRGSENAELYWKNRKPRENYWQQDVHYQIRAELDDKAETIKGKLWVRYYNNSPHAIKEAFFHLYQNSYQPGTLSEEKFKVNKTPYEFGKYEAANLGTAIQSFEVSYPSGAGETPLLRLPFEINNTILKCTLPKALAAGDSMDFYIDFTTYFDRGSIRRRMKVYDHDGVKHFNGVHWYPRLCVYDAKFTWETQQHIDKEFYGDFGQYDVELILPKKYIVEATGVNLNRNSIFDNKSWANVQISKFKDRKSGDPITSVFSDTLGTHTWKFHAINVHDFAWTADPTYRIDIKKYKNIECIALAQENNAQNWQPTATFLASVVKMYSEDFGPYLYPKIVAADAADGMEYPMLTLDGGVYPSHQGLIAHEVGHNWFFGMIGSNETYRACMDEGFTQFLTAWSMAKTKKDASQPNNTEFSTAYAGYLSDAIKGKDKQLNTHSDDFENAIGHDGGYRHVYYKTATMLYNLQYVLGDEVFLKAMQDYVKSWSLCHPYIEDFRNSITNSAKTDLNWFFDQWFESNKTVDYGIKKVKHNDSGYAITFKRKGEMIMPVDFTVSFKDRSTKNYTIPVSYFSKHGTRNTSPWIGWGMLRQIKTVQVYTKEKIENVVIDPSGRLADVYRVDNTWKKRCDLKFDWGNGMVNNIASNYKMKWRPDLWYNQIDGLKAGIHLDGNYAMFKHIFSLNTWYATGISPYFVTNLNNRISYVFRYDNNYLNGHSINLNSMFVAGVLKQQVGWQQKIKLFTVGANLNFLRNTNNNYWNIGYNNSNVLRFQNSNYNWPIDANNFTFNLTARRDYSVWGKTGFYGIKLRQALPGSDYQYAQASGEWINNLPIKKLNFRTRIFAMLGSNGNVAPESMLYLAGASPEDKLGNKFTRELNSIPLGDMVSATEGVFDRTLNLGGGLNLRGYNGYLIPQKMTGDTNTYIFNRGNSGISVNGELDFSNLFLRKRILKIFHIKPYLFGDAGILQWRNPANNSVVNSGIVADAGAGFIFSINDWENFFGQKFFAKTIGHWALLDAKPLNIRIEFPLFLNAAPNSEAYLQFRWQVGINAAF